jgi:squalene-associated FAD-dependent desaturase
VVSAAPRVLVVGGGFAGLACATRLADEGLAVTLLEGRGTLGGRAQSFVHAATGDELDTGQHVFMGCYHETFRYLERIGARQLVRVQPSLEVALVTKEGRRATLAAPPLPAPLHLAVALLRHGMLSLREKLLCLRVIGDARARWDDEALDALTVARWLESLGQSRNACEALWDPLCLATLNTSPVDAPASLLAVVIVKGLLGRGQASSLALSTVSLSRLHAEPALAHLERRGARVLLNEPVSALVHEGGRCVGAMRRDGSVERADCVVSAVPGPMLHRLLPEDTRADAPFATLPVLGRSPIVSLHLWLDRPVLDVPFVGFVGTRLHWAFDRARVWGSPAKGGHLVSLVVSGAEEFAAMEKEQVLAICWAEMQAALPSAREARILDWAVVKEKEATFLVRPGQARLRFGPTTPVEGLLVAGDWTATGLPATIEGACASGHAAAREALRLAVSRP